MVLAIYGVNGNVDYFATAAKQSQHIHEFLVLATQARPLRHPAVDGMTWLGGNHVDHFFGRGVTGSGFEVLERGPLSDHPPIRVRISL